MLDGAVGAQTLLLGLRGGLACAGVLLLAACGAGHQSSTSTGRTSPASSGPGSSSALPTNQALSRGSTPPGSAGVPRFAHVVIVIEENHSYDQIIGNPEAPYLNELAARGALFTDSYAITHPSQPNYVALFSGSTQGVTDDSCPQTLTGPNLATTLAAHGLSFAGYAEDLPAAGYAGCSAGEYSRKHAPWTDFTNVPQSASQPFSAFPSDYARLPTVTFVVPNLQHDMHDGSVARADAWLRDGLSGYLDWARHHGSLLVVTFDEDDFGPRNQIATIFAGAHVAAGRYGQRIDHYTLLRTIEASYVLPPLGVSAARTPITTAWRSRG